MTKNNFYKYAAVALLLLHFVVIGFFLLRQPPPPPHLGGGPKNIIIKRLAFDQEQQIAYQNLITAHRVNIREEIQQIELLKQTLYKTLQNNPPHPRQTDSLIREIALSEQQIEQIHFAHFLDIKKLCRGHQLAKFNALTEDLALLFAHDKKPPRRE